MRVIVWLLIIAAVVYGYVHPITTRGRYFVDSVTNQPVCIKFH